MVIEYWNFIHPHWWVKGNCRGPPTPIIPSRQLSRYEWNSDWISARGFYEDLLWRNSTLWMQMMINIGFFIHIWWNCIPSSSCSSSSVGARGMKPTLPLLNNRFPFDKIYNHTSSYKYSATSSLSFNFSIASFSFYFSPLSFSTILLNDIANAILTTSTLSPDSIMISFIKSTFSSCILYKY